jgi:hypothetical protein
VQARHPLARPRQRNQPFATGKLAIQRLLGVTDAHDAGRIGIRAQPRLEDPIVPLTERIQELLVGERHPLLTHRVAPGTPVVIP